MRYFIDFAYNGAAFHGSQRQPNGITVQEVMEDAFATILREPLALTFAGRTDAGVHAEHMFAHFDCNEAPSVDRLNSLLPATITVWNLFPVSDDLHARFSALARTYEYRITYIKDPFRQDLVTRVAPGLDFEAMNNAAKTLLGTQDFASFCKMHTDVKTTICTITQANWSVLHQQSDLSSISEAVFSITADRFLRNMVRAIVGTLFEVGRGRMTIDEFRGVISNRNRCSAGQSVPAAGLYLTEITYPK